MLRIYGTWLATFSCLLIILAKILSGTVEDVTLIPTHYSKGGRRGRRL